MLVVGIALAMTVVAALLGGSRPATDARTECPNREGCSECHKNQIPPSHTHDFLSDWHGGAAHAHPTSCLGCHKQSQCDDCHLRKAPVWHGAGVTRPQLDDSARRLHGQFGRQRSEDCMACHAQSFHIQCSGCHLFSEFSE